MKFSSGLCICLACLLCLIGMTACGGTEEPVDTTPTTTAPTTPTTMAIIEKDLGDMITREELSTAMGVEMTEPSVSGQGTVLTSVGVEAKVTLNVEVAEKSREIFDLVLLDYPLVEPCPNLGETAWYSSIYHHLLVYDSGYMMTVELFGYEGSEESEMLACRQVAALMLEHLVDIAELTE